MPASVQNEPGDLKYLMWQKNDEVFPVFIMSHIRDSSLSAKPVQCYSICQHLDLLLLSFFEIFITPAENVLHNGSLEPLCLHYLIQPCYGIEDSHIILTFTLLSAVIHRCPSQDSHAPQ